MKKRFLYLCIGIFTISSLAACDKAASAEPATESETLVQNQFSEINSFRDYTWETSMDDITNTEITSDMIENANYRWDSENGLELLTLTEGQVAGYDTSISYGFVDGKLECGGYDPDIDETNYVSLVDKYSATYGEPVLNKESTGWGSCALWIDDNKNMVSISEIMGIIYIANDSTFIEYFNDSFTEFHEIDLYNELERTGSDGI